jgi:cell fate regulator YaaT (PSP1 superfamily)
MGHGTTCPSGGKSIVTNENEPEVQTSSTTLDPLWVVRVRVRRAGRVFLYLTPKKATKIGDKCIVETKRGIELGAVVSAPVLCDDENAERVLSKIVRAAAPRDIIRHEENKTFERDAFRRCHDMIEERKMEMKLVRAEATFDRKKVVFYFSAENRVDFRDLVKDLAGEFRARIELRQIGVRDEARLIGGLGVCGRSLCCATFLKEFAPVSIRMAKKQNLALNPSKISGLCGRLMCCILYEDEQYSKGHCPRKDKGKDKPCDGCGAEKVEVADPKPAEKRVEKTAETVKPVAKDGSKEERDQKNAPPPADQDGKKKPGRSSRRRRGGRRRRGKRVD